MNTGLFDDVSDGENVVHRIDFFEAFSKFKYSTLYFGI